MKTANSLRNGHWPVFIISMTSAIANLFLPIVLVRILEPNEMGVYKIFFLYVQSIMFLSLTGGPLYSVFYWIGHKTHSKDYIKHAWILCLVLSVLAACLGLVFITPLSDWVNMSIKQTMLLVVSAITAAPASYYGEYLIAKGKRVAGSFFNSGFEILKAIIIICIVSITKHIDHAFLAFTVLFFVKLILAFYLGKKEDIISTQYEKGKLADVWKYCAPISIAGLLGFFLEKVDMLLLSSRLTPENFAYYSMGCLIIPPIYILEMSVQKVLIPQLSSDFHHQNYKSMQEHYKKAQADIAFLTIPAVFGLIIFNVPIIKILFTEQYIESAQYLKIFAISYLAYIIPHDAIARASGQTKWILKMYLVLTPLSIVSVYAMAVVWGAKGALITSIFFFFLPKVPGLILSAQVTKSRIRDLIAWKNLSTFTLINIVLLFLSLWSKIYFEDDKWWFIVIGPIYAIIYLTSAFYLKKAQNKYV